MGAPSQRLIAATAGASAALLLNRAHVGAETKPAEALGGRILDLPGGDLHVVDEGTADGPPIVLLHGFAGSLRWFDRLVPLLTDLHRVVRIDELGHGGSAKPRGPYTIEAQAELVSQAMAALGIASAPVVGHSMGGAIAVALAESDPQRVESLLILDEGPDNSFGSQPLIARLGFVPVIGELMHRLAFDPLVRDGYKDAFGDGFEVPDHVVSDFRQMTYASYKGCWAGETTYLDDVRLDERVRRLDLPRTVVFGDQDKFFDPEKSADAFRRVDGVRVETISGVGHSPNVERPEAVAAFVGQAAGAPA